jgi:hypothetical protein
VIDRLRTRNEIVRRHPAARGPRARVRVVDAPILRGVLPAASRGDGRAWSAPCKRAEPLGGLVLMGTTFVLMQVLAPLHLAVGANLGSRTAAGLRPAHERACARRGSVTLEDPKLMTDLRVARDFDLGIMGPPLAISMDSHRGGLVQFVAGVASALLLLGFAWWAPILLAGAWLATHWLLRESAV